MIKAGQCQTILPYNLIEQIRYAIKDAGKEVILNMLLDIAQNLPLSDCFKLIDHNLPLVTTLTTSAWTTNKVLNTLSFVTLPFFNSF